MAIIGFLAMVVGIIMGEIVLIKGKGLVGTYGRMYQNGLDLGCTTLTDFESKVRAVFGNAVSSNPTSNSVTVKASNGQHSIVLKDGKAYMVYPANTVKFTKTGRSIALLKLPSTITLSAEASKIMDTLALQYNPTANEGAAVDYSKGDSCGKNLIISLALAFGGIILVLIVAMMGA